MYVGLTVLARCQCNSFVLGGGGGGVTVVRYCYNE
jgi:hypothetical protein